MALFAGGRGFWQYVSHARRFFLAAMNFPVDY